MISTTVLATAAISLVIGALIGALLTRSLGTPEQQTRELERKLEDTERRMSDYQQQVTEHFMETSQRVNKLTQSYKEVHEYLANSALNLTNPEISRQLLDAGSGDLKESQQEKNYTATDNTTLESDDMMPPKDWAPRKEGEQGQLSEDFSLESEKESIEQTTAAPPPH